ncbi:MAG: hypothetical protein LUG91_00880 [Ruminococcus sp.]|nr:hypothetical protein [Ruminococcus sp.]
MLRIIKSGVSVFILECSFRIVTFVFINRAVSLYGTIDSSVYTIIMNWTLVCFNLIMGIAQSVQPLISVSFCAGDVKRVRTYRKYALIISALLGTAFIIIGYSFTPQLVGVFATDSKELIDLTTDSFRMYLPAYLFMGVGICIGIYYQSIESSMKSLLIMSLRGIILPVVGAVCLTGLFGGTGLWITVPLAELLTGIIVLLSLAFKGSCIMIRRCADYVLRGKYKVVSVFIHAPLAIIRIA